VLTEYLGLSGALPVDDDPPPPPQPRYQHGVVFGVGHVATVVPTTCLEYSRQVNSASTRDNNHDEGCLLQVSKLSALNAAMYREGMVRDRVVFPDHVRAGTCQKVNLNRK
jgi:hypothetical protein